VRRNFWTRVTTATTRPPVTMPTTATISIAEFKHLIEGIVHRTIKHAVPDSIIEVLPDSEWSMFLDWNNFSDAQIADRTGVLALDLAGEVTVATEASYPARGAFVLPFAELGTFIASHAALYGEQFFSGDVILCCQARRAIWIFHHEGGYSLLDIP
jgi:hypothetical protein